MTIDFSTTTSQQLSWSSCFHSTFFCFYVSVYLPVNIKYWYFSSTYYSLTCGK